VGCCHNRGVFAIVVSVSVLTWVFARPRWRARVDGVVGLSHTLVIQFVGCEGCHRRSSCSEIVVGTRASGNWSRRVGRVRCGDSVRCWDAHSTAPFVTAPFVLPE
jgi:hypothetical protein